MEYNFLCSVHQQLTEPAKVLVRVISRSLMAEGEVVSNNSSGICISIGNRNSGCVIVALDDSKASCLGVNCKSFTPCSLEKIQYVLTRGTRAEIPVLKDRMRQRPR